MNQADCQMAGNGRLAFAFQAFANKCVFARNDKEMICLSLAADEKAGTGTGERKGVVQ